MSEEASCHPGPILVLEGNASSVGRRLCRKKFRPGQLSSNHSKPFLQHDDRFQHLVYQQYSSFQPVRTYKRTITAQAGNQGWDLGRFFRTLYFFNGPPSPAKFIEFVVGKLSNPSPSEPVNAMDSSGIVLVAGATGGVGRRVVNILRNKGLPVRVLVRNKDKARSMLGPDIDLVVGDITKDSTLAPEYFKGVKKVINAVSVIVGPKEGDTPDRAKYSQGIKFFEPEIKGDSPEMVEYIGMKILINAVKASVGVRSGKLIYGYEGNSVKELAWGALDDVVMGGVSESSYQVDPTGGENGRPTGLFKGVVSTANNGGFTSIRTRNFPGPEDLSAYDGVELRLKGDGRRYKLIVRTSSDWDTIGYTLSFDTIEGQWQSVRLPFSSLRPIFRARTVSDAPPFDPSNILSLQACFYTYQFDAWQINTFISGRKGLPQVLIHHKIHDVFIPCNLIRESGIPYTIVRPCALTEEPAGADLIFDQGDNITPKKRLMESCGICLCSYDITFEVAVVFTRYKPGNETSKGAEWNLIVQQVYGITGKEVLEQNAQRQVGAMITPLAVQKNFANKKILKLFSSRFKVIVSAINAEMLYVSYFLSNKKGCSTKGFLEWSLI
ncbi:hypothetical protein RHSIM_Rhsim02G0147000 [Rhododendron simsii]|uniref:Uncharacterized protein n=1 Tax=Rhododendron simsii TaxID=118357 RepID=A0A834LX41_RHOSS|nr:hypothetical protein RHSIM_Rhsim02G0147000 [Rhododendron simsii]